MFPFEQLFLPFIILAASSILSSVIGRVGIYVFEDYEDDHPFFQFLYKASVAFVVFFIGLAALSLLAMALTGVAIAITEITGAFQ